MAFTCAVCRFRARRDGSRKNKDCARHRAARPPGGHWELKRLRRELGEVADRFGDFVHGACVASLSHRHDVRMGIASGMHLREHIVSSATLRLEVLCVTHLCYWKWPAATFLRRLLRRAGELLGADAQGRASLYELAWAEAAALSARFSVVCHRGRRTVELWPCARARALGEPAADDYCLYDVAGGDPSAQCRGRAGARNFAVLMQDLRSGHLEGALAKVARAFAAPGATYSACDAHLRTLQLWKNARRSRLNFLCWLFKAEGATAETCAEDWALLSGTGSGAEKGVEAAGGLAYLSALAACEVVSKHVWAAPGASYGLADLACFLHLSQSHEVVGSKILPPPPAAITVASDLGDIGPSSRTQVPRNRLRGKKAAHGGESRQPPAAGSSCAGISGCAASSSGACRPAAWRPPRWRAGLLRPQVRVTTPWVQVLQSHVLQTIMDELPLRDQVALSRTSRAQQGRCLAAARRWGLARWNTVSYLVAQALRADQPLWSKERGTGVGIGNLCRAAACAVDFVDVLCARPLPTDAPLLALALARWGLKFELCQEVLERLRGEFMPGGHLHMPGVGDVEAWLLLARAGKRRR